MQKTYRRSHIRTRNAIEDDSVKVEGYEQLAETILSDFYKRFDESFNKKLDNLDVKSLTLRQDEILAVLRKDLDQYVNEATGKPITEDQKEEVLSFIKRQVWGYGIIDELIHDKDISDIKIYDAKNIRIKKKGKRSGVSASFESDEKYLSFIAHVAEKNKVNLGAANAIRTFTDNSLDDFILRITIITGLLCDSGLPCLCIRKISKQKLSLADLNAAGMFDEKVVEQKSKVSVKEGKALLPKDKATFEALLKEMVASKGILITGKGASGKTTLLNALLGIVSADESVMIAQENTELFDATHPDILTAHVMVNDGDSKITYSLGDLTRAALLIDVDRVIVGEVKDSAEAAALSKASMTGHKCITSVHGESCELGVEKMADYITQGTGYKRTDALRQLLGFEYVIHLKDFRIDEIVKITRFDDKTERLILEHIYPKGGLR